MSSEAHASGNTIGAVLAAHRSSRPDATLLIAPETRQTLTYKELETSTRLLARYLRAKGVHPGDTVALYLHNGYQTTALFLGIMALGYVVAPLNLLSQKSQLSRILQHARPRLIFTCVAHAEMISDAMADIPDAPEIIVIDVDAAQIFPDSSESSGAIPLAFDGVAKSTELALLMYTSGTTGAPKGVMLSHSNLLSGARAIAQWHSLGPEDRVLSSLPLYHINGQVIATLAPFVSGGSIVAPHRFSTSQWWGLVETYRCTWINMVPTIVAYLLNSEQPQRQTFSGLKFARSASAPLPIEHHQAFEARFGVPLVEGMGMTECASTVFCNPHGDRRRSGSAGLPCGAEAGIIDAQGVHLRPNQVGEIILRGPNVMMGYFRDAEKTREAIDADGWLRTGDLGYRDADGFYYITGRLKELIIKGGENIAPREIDEALLRHPVVLEAAAFAIPDTNYGQEIAVAIILKPGTSVNEDEIRSWCLKELGKYKTPLAFHVVDELPKGPSGKIQRLKLAELLDR